VIHVVVLFSQTSSGDDVSEALLDSTERFGLLLAEEQTGSAEPIRVSRSNLGM